MATHVLLISSCQELRASSFESMMFGLQNVCWVEAERTARNTWAPGRLELMVQPATELVRWETVQAW